MANHGFCWRSDFLHGVCWNQNGDQMIEAILQPFDFILQMPIERQCEFSIGLSFAGFCIAAFLREVCKDHHIRFAARALGAAAFFAVAAFAVHATQQVEELEQQLFVREGKKISAEIAVTVTSKKGNTIQIGECDGLRGVRGELRQHDGSLRSGSGKYSTSSGGFAAGSVGGNGSDGRSHVLVDDVARLLECTKRYAFGQPANAGGFEFSGEAKGQSF